VSAQSHRLKIPVSQALMSQEVAPEVPQGLAVDLKVLQGPAVDLKVLQGLAVDLKVLQGPAVDLKAPEDQEGVNGCTYTYLLSAK
jgi:hypothetical protein